MGGLVKVYYRAMLKFAKLRLVFPFPFCMEVWACGRMEEKDSPTRPYNVLPGSGKGTHPCYERLYRIEEANVRDCQAGVVEGFIGV